MCVLTEWGQIELAKGLYMNWHISVDGLEIIPSHGKQVMMSTIEVVCLFLKGVLHEEMMSHFVQNVRNNEKNKNNNSDIYQCRSSNRHINSRYP